jgi:molecular chaperone HtpG
LYFPKIGNAMEVQRNKIHLYCNQVFVTDDVRDIVPEWLLLLHGIIDSPDIPLNVSRSYLQSDGNVKKISEYISKKVADKLNELFKADQPAFEDKWKDLGVFVKYGMVSDPKFQERAMSFALVTNTEGEHFLLKDYSEKIKPVQTDKHNKVVCIYTNAAEAQDAYIRAARQRGYDVLNMDTVLDNHWMQHLEYRAADLNLLFVRVDSDTADKLVQKDETATSALSEAEVTQVKSAFEAVATNTIGARVECQPLSPNDQPVVITKPEFMRRMKEMQAMQGMGGMDFPESYNVVVNTNHPLIVQKLVKLDDTVEQAGMAKYLYDLALLQQGMLRGESLTAFVEKTLAKL